MVPKKRQPVGIRSGEHLLLPFAAVRHQQVGVAAGQHARAADADAGLGEEGVRRHLDHAGQLHAAHLVVLRRRPACRTRRRRAPRTAAPEQDDLLAVEPGSR